MNNEKCPNPKCGKSNYRLGRSERTDRYYPPVYKDGINLNPDKNTITTELKCLECGNLWEVIKYVED